MPKRILLVEDETPIRETLTDLFAPCGYIMKTAPEGNQAINTLRLFRPHLIISDIMMPGMDGIKLLQQLKSDPDWNDIPVILLTAKKEFEARIEGLQTGADAYIAKPFNIHELLLTVENLLALKNNILKSSFLHQQELEETPDEVSFTKKLSEFLSDHLNDLQLNLEQTASHFKLSPSGIKKKLKRITGKSFQEVVREFRLDKSRQYLATQCFNVSEVASMTGFKSSAHFSDAFKKHFGITPSSLLN